ncbi:hypothetical protein COL27_30020, partial [Bacillus sp. AFS075960]
MPGVAPQQGPSVSHAGRVLPGRFPSAHGSSLWNHCASTTRSRVTSKFSCRASPAKCGCTYAESPCTTIVTWAT